MNAIFLRYAIALFSLAKEENKIEIYLDEAKQLIDICSENELLITFLKDYGIENTEKKQVLETIFKGKIQNHLLYFLYVVVDNQRAKNLKEILQEFVKFTYKHLNIQTGIIYSTLPLQEETIIQIENKVAKMMHCKIKLKNQIDAQLLGGFKIVVSDTVFDNSILNRIQTLKKDILEQIEKEDFNEN